MWKWLKRRFRNKTKEDLAVLTEAFNEVYLKYSVISVALKAMCLRYGDEADLNRIVLSKELLDQAEAIVYPESDLMFKYGDDKGLSVYIMEFEKNGD